MPAHFDFPLRAPAEKLNPEKLYMPRSVARRRPHQRLQLCGERKLRFAQYHVFSRL
jgi:hypothetical protein